MLQSAVERQRRLVLPEQAPGNCRGPIWMPARIPVSAPVMVLLRRMVRCGRAKAIPSFVPWPKVMVLPFNEVVGGEIFIRVAGKIV